MVLFPSTIIESIDSIQVTDKQHLSTKVVPGNAIHLVIHEGPGIRMQTGNNAECSMSGAWLCGHLTKQKSFVIPFQSSASVIKLKSWASSNILGINLFDVIDGEVHLNDILPRDLNLQWEDGTLDLMGKVDALLSYFQQRLQQFPLMPALVYAIHTIEQQSGNLRVGKLADHLGFSRRKLERIFKDFIGITIKKFMTVSRFRHAFEQVRQERSVPEIVFNCGYYDQTHFIEEFRAYSGETPDNFTRNNLAAGFYLK
jgi:AraC-like DNA-binding protein